MSADRQIEFFAGFSYDITLMTSLACKVLTAI